MFILPVTATVNKISTINDVIDMYNITTPSELDYRFFIMKFPTFFEQLIEDIKSSFYLVSLSTSANNNTIYARYNPNNEYEWYNWELYPMSWDITPFSLSWMTDLNATITFYIPETELNIFKITIPKPIEFVDLYGLSQDAFSAILSGGSEAAYNTSSGVISGCKPPGKRQYFHDRYAHSIDLGQIVGNKVMSMTANTK